MIPDHHRGWQDLKLTKRISKSGTVEMIPDSSHNNVLVLLKIVSYLPIFHSNVCDDVDINGTEGGTQQKLCFEITLPS